MDKQAKVTPEGNVKHTYRLLSTFVRRTSAKYQPWEAKQPQLSGFGWRPDTKTENR